MCVSWTLALVLEDEPLIAIALEQDLIDAGFSIATVDSSKAAHSWLDANTPSVVVVDILLKDGPCESFVVRLVNAKIPFLVHSGDNPTHYEGTPFAKGQWMSKPARMEDLRTCLTALSS